MSANLVELAPRLLELGTATLYEASGIDCDLDCRLRPAWSGARLAGAALPVRTGPADNLALHLALEQAAPGEVLVVDACGLACGYWGEVLTAAAEQRGVVGLVIDGGVRDVEQLAARGFPTFSRAVSVRRTIKHDPGSVGAAIVVAGRQVERGDAVVADADGVVVIPRALVTQVVDAALVRVAKEEGYLREIRAGASTVDLLALREADAEPPRG